MAKRKPNTANSQLERVGKISDEERAACAPAYLQHCKVCKKYGIEPEAAERFLTEFVETNRSSALETPADPEPIELWRDYARQAYGGDGGGRW